MSTLIPHLTALNALPLFQGLAANQLAHRTTLLHLQTVPAGTTLSIVDQPGAIAYLVLAGTIKIHVDQAGGTMQMDKRRQRGQHAAT